MVRFLPTPECPAGCYDHGTWNSTLQFTAFGEVRAKNGVTPGSYRYTGQLEQAELGLYYYVARWYDPAIAHFAQADTIVPSPDNSEAYDRYAYVINNPILLNDPSGHDVGCPQADPRCQVLHGETDRISLTKGSPSSIKLDQLYSRGIHPGKPKSTPTPTNTPTSTLLPTTTHGYDPNAAGAIAQTVQPSWAATQTADKETPRCTEALSEILRDAGLPTTAGWNPGTISWVRTPAFFDYLTSLAGVSFATYHNKDEYNTRMASLDGNDKWEIFVQTNLMGQAQCGDIAFYHDTNLSDYTHVALVVGWGTDAGARLTPLVVDVNGSQAEQPHFVDSVMDPGDIEKITIVFIR